MEMQKGEVAQARMWAAYGGLQGKEGSTEALRGGASQRRARWAGVWMQDSGKLS